MTSSVLVLVVVLLLLLGLAHQSLCLAAPDAIAIAGEGEYILVTQRDGAIYGSGDNYFGQLGLGHDIQNVRYADRMKNVVNATQATGGWQRTCFLEQPHMGVKCAGTDKYGVFASVNDAVWVPMPVNGLNSGVRKLAVAATQSCAILDASGAVRCWGEKEISFTGGVLGMVSTTVLADSDSEPWYVNGFETGGAADIALGTKFACVLNTAGGIVCGGTNRDFEVGSGSSDSEVSFPTPILDPNNGVGLATVFIAVSCGPQHACAISDAGGMYCWGSNDYSNLGDGTRGGESFPKLVPGLASNVRSMYLSNGVSYAFLQNGTLLKFGDNEFESHQKYPPVVLVAPTAVFTDEQIVQVAGGRWTTAILTAGGQVKFVGINNHGQYGMGDEPAWSATPVDMLDVSLLPTQIPTRAPTVRPTKKNILSNKPTKSPTEMPTKRPTRAPTASKAPTKVGHSSGGERAASGGRGGGVVMLTAAAAAIFVAMW